MTYSLLHRWQHRSSSSSDNGHGLLPYVRYFAPHRQQVPVLDLLMDAIHDRLAHDVDAMADPAAELDDGAEDDGEVLLAHLERDPLAGRSLVDVDGDFRCSHSSLLWFAESDGIV